MPASEVQSYEGHQIELKRGSDVKSSEAESFSAPSETSDQLYVDGRNIPYGKLQGGKYYLHDYAYDWDEDLISLAKKYIDYSKKR